MNLRLKALDLFFPGRLKRQRFGRLIALTASAFGSEAPKLAGLSFDEALRGYALFTRDESRRSAGQHLVVKERLFEKGRIFGQELRYVLKVRTKEDALDAARFLYRVIGIDFCGTRSGDFQVDRCYFAKFYSSEVCKTMESLDEGLFAGLSGGGGLKFSRIITEGHASCKGTITFNELRNETSNSRGHGCWWCNCC